MSPDEPIGLTTQQVSRLADTPVSTLDHWIRTGLVRPSIRPPQGRRVARYWSVQDLVTVRTIRTLRQAGCTLAGVRQVKRVIEAQWSDDLSSVHVYWDGADVRAVDEWAQLVSLLEQPGQQVLHLVAIPVETWANEAARAANPIDQSVLRTRRRKRARRSPVQTRPLVPRNRSA
jgi:DNA-binding transcriptional MerR regulator